MPLPDAPAARAILAIVNPDRRDFHALCSAAVELTLSHADACRYRKPYGANGSRARYFHAALIRRAGATVFDLEVFELAFQGRAIRPHTIAGTAWVDAQNADRDDADDDEGNMMGDDDGDLTCDARDFDNLYDSAIAAGLTIGKGGGRLVAS